MIISDLIKTVRHDYLEDHVAPYLWDDPSLYRKFTEAERQACNRADLIFDDITSSYCSLTLLDGISTYTIDPKITRIMQVRFNGTVVEKKTAEELDRSIAEWRTTEGMTNQVCYYQFSGRKIRFAPIPNSDDAGLKVYMDVYRLPEDDIVSGGQEPEIPQEFHRDLIYWVLHECYKKQDADTFNQEKSDYYLARFNEVFGNIVSARVRQHQLESPTILTIRPY